VRAREKAESLVAGEAMWAWLGQGAVGGESLEGAKMDVRPRRPGLA